MATAPNSAMTSRMKRIQDLAFAEFVGVSSSISTIIGARIRALTGARRTRLTSIANRSRQPHEFSCARGRCRPRRLHDWNTRRY